AWGVGGGGWITKAVVTHFAAGEADLGPFLVEDMPAVGGIFGRLAFGGVIVMQQDNRARLDQSGAARRRDDGPLVWRDAAEPADSLALLIFQHGDHVMHHPLVARLDLDSLHPPIFGEVCRNPEVEIGNCAVGGDGGLLFYTPD